MRRCPRFLSSTSGLPPFPRIMPGVGPSEVIVKREIHKQLPRLQEIISLDQMWDLISSAMPPSSFEHLTRLRLASSWMLSPCSGWCEQRLAAAAADVLRRRRRRRRRVVAFGIAKPVVNRGWVRRRRFLLLWPERSRRRPPFMVGEGSWRPTGDRPH